jgi:membrane-bound serine protease (ClpP class)
MVYCLQEFHVNSLDLLMTDPNFVYLVLLFSLWVAVTAAYVPGTGVVEALAVIGLIIALVLMTSMPTNWGSVLLLVLGVLTFLLVPFLTPRLALLAQGGLILQAVGGALLFNGLSVSWLIIAITIGIALLYHNFALLPLLRHAREQKAVIDDNGQLVGMTGRVSSAFASSGASFVGTVNVRSEQWTAFSDKPLLAGDEVVVIERDGLQLLVEGLKHKQAPKEEVVS